MRVTSGRFLPVSRLPRTAEQDLRNLKFFSEYYATTVFKESVFIFSKFLVRLGKECRREPYNFFSPKICFWRIFTVECFCWKRQIITHLKLTLTSVVIHYESNISISLKTLYTIFRNDSLLNSRAYTRLKLKKYSAWSEWLHCTKVENILNGPVVWPDDFVGKLSCLGFQRFAIFQSTPVQILSFKVKSLKVRCLFLNNYETTNWS